MKRIQVFLEEDQIKFLKERPGTVSDNARKAVGEYIKKLQNDSVSESKSERKGGD